MANSNTATKVLILVLILAVPGFLYYLLTSQGKNRYKPLPFFGPKVLSGTFHKYHGKNIPDTTYHKVAGLDLQDQNGKPVSFKSIGDQILVVNFFYTHGKEVTTQLIGHMDSLAKYYGKNNLVKFVSITVDPQRDDPATLKRYAAGFNSRPGKWMFLTGDTSVIYPLARKGFLVDALQADKDNFIYSNKLIMLDPEHRIRGYYDGTVVAEINRLNDELKVQISEELRKIKAPN